MVDTTQAQSAILPVSADGTGLFSWDLVADKISGDAEMARLFLLDPLDLSTGLPVQALIGRMHADDRVRVAKSLHTAIVEGTLYRELCRVEGKDGRYFQVLCLARCFGYENGLPSICSGFVCEMTSVQDLTQYPAGGNVLPFKRPGR